MVDPTIVDTYKVGKEGFIVGLCEALGLPETINQALESVNGRPTDIPLWCGCNDHDGKYVP